MSLGDALGRAGHALLAAGTAVYDCRDFQDLDKVPDALRTVVETLRPLGFSTVAKAPGYSIDPTVRRMRAAVKSTASAAPIVVVYYIGHGAYLERDTYYLVSKKSRPADLGGTALPARDLLTLLTRRDDDGGLLADQPVALVILDCCYSGSAGMEMLGEALRDIGNPNTWVIASAGALEYAQQGEFAKAFCDALRRPTIGTSQRFVSLDTIVQAVNDAQTGVGQHAWLFTPARGYSGIPPFFVNPNYRPDMAGLTVAEQHWLSRLRGGPETSTTGFYLAGRTGRVRAGKDLAAWIADPHPKGLAVVTGSPGAGKSALLALPVLLTQRIWRERLLGLAEPGSLIAQAAELIPPHVPIAAVHARGLNTDQAAGVIAQALGRAPRTASALLEDLEATPERGGRVVAVDAIDEAVSPATLLASLLLPLARQPGLGVVVGARRHVLSPVGEADLTIDLDSANYRDPQALADYVHRLLVASEEPGVTTPYQSATSAATAAVAEAIARRSTARDKGPESFLIGRLLALSLRGRANAVGVTSCGWQGEIPASVAEAFDEDLARLRNKEPLARTLLAALAWAKGPGLPWENVWVSVARTIARHNGFQAHRPISDDDVRWLLDRAGAYVVEDLGPGQRSVYRPFHDLLAAHLRGELSPRTPDAEPARAHVSQQHRARTEKAITAALLATVPTDGHTRDWKRAHPYLRTYLAQHAAAAGLDTFTALLQEADFLAVADPVTLNPLLPPTIPGLHDVARAYRRARPLLGENPRANAAYLQEASYALTRTTGVTYASISPIYRTERALVSRDDSLLTLTGHTDAVTSVAFGSLPDGSPLLASGSHDGTVRLWDPVTGTPFGEPLAHHTDAVESVAFGTLTDGRLLLASGSDDGTVRLWDPVTGRQIGEPLTGHTDWVRTVAFGALPDGRQLLGSGSNDGTVRLWDPVTGRQIGEPLTGHTGAVEAIAFCALPDGRLLLASSGEDQTIRRWDSLTGAPVGEPLTGHTRSVPAVAFSTGPGGRTLLASGADEVRLWDPLTGAPVGKPFPADARSVMSLVFGTGSDQHLLLASAGDDGTVRLWDPATGRQVGEPLTGHTHAVQSVAFGAGLDGSPLLASGGYDWTVRLWDPAPAGPPRRGLNDHTGSVVSAAFGSVQGASLLALIVQDGIQVWDLMTGVLSPMRLDDFSGSVWPGWSVALGAGSDGRLLLASGSANGTVRLWDPLAGGPIGQPLTAHNDWVESMAFGTRPDGRLLLASGSHDGTVRLWDPATGRQVGEPLTHSADWVQTVAFGTMPDGQLRLASGSNDRTVRLWDPVTGAPVGEPLTGHTDWVRSVAFGTLPDGQFLLASSGRDCTVRLWDPITGAPVGEPLSGHTDDVTAVAFVATSDGHKLLVSGSDDRTIRLWDPASTACIMTLRRRVGVRFLATADRRLAVGDDEGVCVIEFAE